MIITFAEQLRAQIQSIRQKIDETGIDINDDVDGVVLGLQVSLGIHEDDIKATCSEDEAVRFFRLNYFQRLLDCISDLSDWFPEAAEIPRPLLFMSYAKLLLDFGESSIREDVGVKGNGDFQSAECLARACVCIYSAQEAIIAASTFSLRDFGQRSVLLAVRRGQTTLH